MDIIGIDHATPGGDMTAIAVRRGDYVQFCTLPDGLGRITDLCERGGRVIAVTESGIPFVVPWTFKSAKPAAKQ